MSGSCWVTVLTRVGSLLRTSSSIRIAQKFISQFVKVARLNGNRMEEEEWRQRWIYNYQAVHAPADYEYTQVYLFD
jgi:hypothetical protein